MSIRSFELNDPDEASEFEYCFPHVFTSIRMLSERITCYHVRGILHGFIPNNYVLHSAPVIVGAKFDVSAAEKYERDAAKYLAGFSLRKPRRFPVPQFPIDVRLDFGHGITETRTFDFGGYYNDETLGAFCSEIKEFSTCVYRHRYAAKKRS